MLATDLVDVEVVLFLVLEFFDCAGLHCVAHGLFVAPHWVSFIAVQALSS